MRQGLAREGLEVGIIAALAVALEQGHGILVGRELHVVVVLGEILAIELGQPVELVLMRLVHRGGQAHGGLAGGDDALELVRRQV